MFIHSSRFSVEESPKTSLLVRKEISRVKDKALNLERFDRNKESISAFLITTFLNNLRKSYSKIYGEDSQIPYETWNLAVEIATAVYFDQESSMFHDKSKLKIIEEIISTIRPAAFQEALPDRMIV